MIKRIISLYCGFFLLVFPILVSAQTSSAPASSSFTAVFTQILHLLEQDFLPLFSAGSGGTVAQSTSGSSTAPDQVAPITPTTISAASNREYTDAIPALTGITPITGSANTVVSLSGTNLSNAVQIAFYDLRSGRLAAVIPTNLVDETGVSISASGVTFPIYAGKLQAPGAYQVKVVTPNGTSNGERFTFTSPTSAAPKMTNIAPPEGWPSTVMTLSGTDLARVQTYKPVGMMRVA